MKEAKENNNGISERKKAKSAISSYEMKENII
jgi:hypothetical protein